jgi:hypothetical protein
MAGARRTALELYLRKALALLVYLAEITRRFLRTVDCQLLDHLWQLAVRIPAPIYHLEPFNRKTALLLSGQRHMPRRQW